jgi:hypothetical protein
MRKRRVTETFATIDEDGNRVIVTRVRYFQRVRKPDGAYSEVEYAPEFRVDGEAAASVEDDPVFRYTVAKTGKKLRLP